MQHGYGNRILQKIIPDCFLNIPVSVEMEPELQIIIPVPAKPEPEIDFCWNSGQNMPEFDQIFLKKVETI